MAARPKLHSAVLKSEAVCQGGQCVIHELPEELLQAGAKGLEQRLALSSFEAFSTLVKRQCRAAPS